MSPGFSNCHLSLERSEIKQFYSSWLSLTWATLNLIPTLNTFQNRKLRLQGGLFIKHGKHLRNWRDNLHWPQTWSLYVSLVMCHLKLVVLTKQDVTVRLMFSWKSKPDKSHLMTQASDAGTHVLLTYYATYSEWPPIKAWSHRCCAHCALLAGSALLVCSLWV